MKVLVSIVVVTFNRADSLRNGLLSLTKITHPANCPLEIVIVDNDSTDNTKEVVIQFQRSLPKDKRVIISYCFEKQPGIPYARNKGVEESQGQWIVFFDDDQLATPDWLQELLNTADNSGALCVGGPRHLNLPHEVNCPIPTYCRKLLGEHLGNGENTKYNQKFLPFTGNILIHRSLLNKYGSFNVDFLEGGEDTEFFMRLRRAKVKMVFAPKAIVDHIIPKERVAKSYFAKVAMRHGVTLARCTHQINGVFMLLCQTTLRCLLSVFQTLPHLLFVVLTQDEPKTLELKCRLSKNMGYLYYSREEFFSTKPKYQDLFHRHSE